MSDKPMSDAEWERLPWLYSAVWFRYGPQDWGPRPMGSKKEFQDFYEQGEAWKFARERPKKSPYRIYLIRRAEVRNGKRLTMYYDCIEVFFKGAVYDPSELGDLAGSHVPHSPSRSITH
jgi:hypothetical protein